MSKAVEIAQHRTYPQGRTQMTNTIHVLSIRDNDDAMLGALCMSIKEHGWEPAVVNGVVGREMSAGDYFDGVKAYFAKTRRLMSPGEVGCTLGHLKIWTAIADGTMEVGVVLEDDALIDSEFGDRLGLLVDYCKTVDCFVSLGGLEGHLGLTRSLVGRRIENVPDTWELLPSELSKLYMTVGYVVSRDTAARMAAEARRALFIADDFQLLYQSSAIQRVLLSNVVGHPWGDHLSAIGHEREFRTQIQEAQPRPLLKRIAAEVMATISSRISTRANVAPPKGYQLLDWESRFRR